MRKIIGSVFVAVTIVALGACSSSGGGGGVAVGGGGDFCSTLKTDAAAFEKLGNSANEGQLSTVMADLVSKAPSEIKADMTAIANAVKSAADFASQLSADPTKAESLASDFLSQEAGLEAASNNVVKFAKDKCGIDLNSSSS